MTTRLKIVGAFPARRPTDSERIILRAYGDEWLKAARDGSGFTTALVACAQVAARVGMAPGDIHDVIGRWGHVIDYSDLRRQAKI